ncbi:MAG TPA: hypothetical protein VE173_08075, partial [Longimicrobiales bacterium]|nr:hypothetical protein [Longimicrobiales bacterium]
MRPRRSPDPEPTPPAPPRDLDRREALKLGTVGLGAAAASSLGGCAGSGEVPGNAGAREPSGLLPGAR